jgi:ribonuclease HII
LFLIARGIGLEGASDIECDSAMASRTAKSAIKENSLEVSLENQMFPWRELKDRPVIGVDEVGRGCLAGPVYAGAVIIPEHAIETLERAGVTDSKKISEKKRDAIADIIIEHCYVGLGFATSDEIDEINILQATFLAMRRSLVSLAVNVEESSSKEATGLGLPSGHILIDGNQKLPFAGPAFEACSVKSEIQKFLAWSKLPQTTLVKGDSRALPIAAASIVAKVTRDRLMIDLDQEFPQYGFKGHKGYAAEIHRTAIKEHGPSPVHRKTFGGVREYLLRQ